MFIIKPIYAFLYFQSVQSLFEDSSAGDAYDDSSKFSSENQVSYDMEHESRNYEKEPETGENRNLNSTIETSLCKYQEIKPIEETDEYKNTLIDYPYAASIQRQGSHYTSGALVDKRWVISSGAEFYNVRESIKLFRVRLGSVDCKRGGTKFPIVSIQVHPSFVHGKPGFDLALLQLAKPVTRTIVISPILRSNIQGTVVKAKFMTAYWPRIVVKGKVLPLSAKERVKFTNMRVSTQKLIPSTKCAKMVDKLNDSNLCLKPVVTYHSKCTPDAGAPVVAKDGLWGITSGWVSPECLLEPSPTVFTRISLASVRFWIDSQLLP